MWYSSFHMAFLAARFLKEYGAKRVTVKRENGLWWAIEK